MIVLDEHIPRAQIEAVRRWTRSALSVGEDFGSKGMSDEQIITQLAQATRPTFFSRDAGFFDRKSRDKRYCLVWLDVNESDVAEFVKRVLRHVDFRTKGKRLGSVVAASPSGLRAWRWKSPKEIRVAWHE
jgi:hypothetical protein